MAAFFKLICKQSGDVKTVFELDVKGDIELDYLNSLKQNCYLKQIGLSEYEWLLTEQRKKNFILEVQS
jgi:hypothetical protein